MDKHVENKIEQNTNSRRKFVLGAAKLAPVVATIASRPVWAGVSISGNLSGNVSGHYEESLIDGCSPGYYNMKVTGNPSNPLDGYHKNSRLPKTEYEKSFNEIFVDEYFLPLGTSAKVFVVLSPSYWGDATLDPASDITQIERKVLTAYYNASIWSGATDYPYTTQQVIDFYIMYVDKLITYDEADTILTNLIHMGNPDSQDKENC